MGRSQRHMIYVQNAPANGEAIAEGQPAPGFILQSGPAAGVLGIEDISVVEGPPGGPLQGSTIIAAVPESIDTGGGGPDPEPGTPVIEGLSPESTLIDTAVQITITGAGFAADSTVQADGYDIISAYISDTEMTADIPSFSSPMTLAITVTTADVVSGATSFEVTATGRKKKGR